MRNFPWIEAALIAALAVALILRPQKQQAPEQAASQSSYQFVLTQ